MSQQNIMPPDLQAQMATNPLLGNMGSQGSPTQQLQMLRLMMMQQKPQAMPTPQSTGDPYADFGASAVQLANQFAARKTQQRQMELMQQFQAQQQAAAAQQAQAKVQFLIQSGVPPEQAQAAVMGGIGDSTINQLLGGQADQMKTVQASQQFNRLYDALIAKGWSTQDAQLAAAQAAYGERAIPGGEALTKYGLSKEQLGDVNALLGGIGNLDKGPLAPSSRTALGILGHTNVEDARDFANRGNNATITGVNAQYAAPMAQANLEGKALSNIGANISNQSDQIPLDRAQAQFELDQRVARGEMSFQEYTKASLINSGNPIEGVDKLNPKLGPKMFGKTEDLNFPAIQQQSVAPETPQGQSGGGGFDMSGLQAIPAAIGNAFSAPSQAAPPAEQRRKQNAQTRDQLFQGLLGIPTKFLNDLRNPQFHGF